MMSQLWHLKFVSNFIIVHSFPGSEKANLTANQSDIPIKKDNAGRKHMLRVVMHLFPLLILIYSLATLV